MFSVRALYRNCRNDLGELLEVTDFSIPTWLAFGAGLQLLCQSWLPSNLPFWAPIIYLVYLFIKVAFDCSRLSTGTTFTNLKVGRWSATIPDLKDSSTVTATNDGVVMFLLGARINQFVYSCSLVASCRNSDMQKDLSANLRPDALKSTESLRTSGARLRRIESDGTVSTPTDGPFDIRLTLRVHGLLCLISLLFF